MSTRTVANDLNPQQATGAKAVATVIALPPMAAHLLGRHAEHIAKGERFERESEVIGARLESMPLPEAEAEVRKLGRRVRKLEQEGEELAGLRAAYVADVQVMVREREKAQLAARLDEARRAPAGTPPNDAAPAHEYTTAELFDDHVRARKVRGKERAQATVESWEGLRVKLEQHLPRLAKDITHHGLLRYVETRRGEGAGERIRKELVFLKAALKLAYKSDLFATDPEKVIPELDSMAKPRQRTLTVEEVWAIVNKLAARSKAGREHAALFAWAVATGAEFGGWKHAKPSDLREDLRGCQVHGTKNEHRDRFAPTFLPEQMKLLAFARKHARGKKGRFFLPWGNTNANRDLKLVCAALGIEPCSTHDVRRTYADWWLAAGVRDSLIDAALGHAPADVLTKHYRRGRFEPEDMLRMFEADVAAHAQRPLDGGRHLHQAPPAEVAGDLRTPPGRPTDPPVDLRTGPIAQSVELRTFNP